MSTTLLQRFHRLKDSAAARNFGWLLVERGARLVLVTGVGFLVARHLGPDRFGALSTALAMVGLALPLAELGLEAVVRREMIQDPERVFVLAGTVRRLRLGGALLAGALLAAVLLTGWVAPQERVLVLILCGTLFQPALCVADTWLQSQLRARTAVVVQLLVLGAGAAARVGLILGGAPLAAFAWTVTGETLLAGLLLVVAARRGGLRFGPFNREVARSLLARSWPLLLSAITVLLYIRIDLLMLRALAGEAAVGIYAAAVRFTEVWYFVPGALAASMLPGLLAARSQGGAAYARRLQINYDLNAALGYALAVPTVLGATWLVRWAYGAAFASSADVLVWHSLSLVFVFLGVSRSQHLVNEGHTRIYLVTTAAGLLANVALNLVLIPRHGAVGAAVATLAAQMVAAWLSTFCFAPLRANAWMQTRALLIPLRWYSYVRRD